MGLDKDSRMNPPEPYLLFAHTAKIELEPVCTCACAVPELQTEHILLFSPTTIRHCGKVKRG